jgi:hypothetical protein
VTARAVAGLVVVVVAAACGNGDTPAGKRSRPPATAATTTLALDVRDAAGRPIGARVLLRGADGTPVRFGSLDLYGNRQAQTGCDFVPGVLGTWDGIILAYGGGEIRVVDADCGIPPGRYHVWAWRGIEYERWEGDVDLSLDRGRVPLAIVLERAWTPAGTLSADLHVHAQASPDSLVPNPQRVVAQVAAGIQVIGLSDHNVNGDLEADIHDLHLDDVVTSIASDELTSDSLHLGVYPVVVVRGVARGGAPIPEGVEKLGVRDMFALAHSFPGNPIVQVNHPRFRVTALFDGTGWNGVSWPPPFPLDFDAVEVLAGYSAANAPGDRRIDDSVRDFYTLIDHGHLIAPMGNSDAHNLNWVHDGLTRNYVFVDDPRVRPFDERGFIAAIRHRRIVATSGPWLDVEVATREGGPTVGPGQTVVPADNRVWVDVTVSQARFVHVDHLRIAVGGQAPVVIPVPPDERTFHWAGAVAVGTTDTWVGVDAGGDTPLPVEQTGSYQQEKWKKPGVTPFAIIGPILVDADGDGRWKRGDTDIRLN